MARTRKVELRCSRCGHAHEVEVYGGINTAEDPELKAAVRDGSLFLWECPHCGTRNLAVEPLLYHDPEQKLMLWLLPEGVMGPEQEAAVSAALERQIADPESGCVEGYTLRRVTDVGSLIEKIHIFEAGLDDVVMEMAKWITRSEMAQKDSQRAEAIQAAAMRFFRMDGADNAIQLTLPLDGAMQVMEIGFHVYEDCRGILQRNPGLRPGAGFARIDAAWIEERLG